MVVMELLLEVLVPFGKAIIRHNLQAIQMVPTEMAFIRLNRELMHIVVKVNLILDYIHIVAIEVAFIRSQAVNIMATSLNKELVLVAATATTFACLVVANQSFLFIYFLGATIKVDKT